MLMARVQAFTITRTRNHFLACVYSRVTLTPHNEIRYANVEVIVPTRVIDLVNPNGSRQKAMNLSS